MEKNLNDVAVHRAVSQRQEAILNAVIMYGVDERDAYLLGKRIDLIIAEERSLIQKAEADMMKAAAEGQALAGERQ